MDFKKIVCVTISIYFISLIILIIDDKNHLEKAKENMRDDFLETETKVLKMSLYNDQIIDWYRVHFNLFYYLNEINLNNECISEYYINYFSFNQKSDTTLDIINLAIEDNKKIIDEIVKSELLNTWKSLNPDYNDTFILLYENILSYLSNTTDYGNVVTTSLTIKKSNMDVIQNYGTLKESYINIKSKLHNVLDDIIFYDGDFIYEAFPEYTFFDWDNVL